MNSVKNTTLLLSNSRGGFPGMILQKGLEGKVCSKKKKRSPKKPKKVVGLAIIREKRRRKRPSIKSAARVSHLPPANRAQRSSRESEILESLSSNPSAVYLAPDSRKPTF